MIVLLKAELKLIITKASRSSIVSLSAFQAISLVITAVGGAAIWFFVANIAHVTELGVLGRIVSTSAFICSVVTAGLGQFLLALVHSRSTSSFRRYFWFGIAVGGSASAILAAVVSVFQGGNSEFVVLAVGLLAGGIAATNLQDALYLGTGMIYDVPTKGATILVFRFVLVLLCAVFATNITALVVAFVGSQLVVALLWLLVRAPKALEQHTLKVLGARQKGSTNRLLMFSYLYSISISSIILGVPAIVTNFTSPAQAGKFYFAWTIASLLSSLSIPIANSIVASPVTNENRIPYFIKILSFAALALSLVSAAIFSGLSNLAFIFNSQYRNIDEQLLPLLIGQVFLGVTIVSLAIYRVLGLDFKLIVFLVAAPALIICSVVAGVEYKSIFGGEVGFVFGNVISTLGIIFALCRKVVASKTLQPKELLGEV